MLQFLFPLWLMALPLTALPWIWPDNLKDPQQVHRFPSLFLFERVSRWKRLRVTRERWWLKALRSLLIACIIFLLAKPFWQQQTTLQKITILDDTFSTLSHLNTNTGSTSAVLEPGQAVRLSELFEKSPYQPLAIHPEFSRISTLSPNLTLIAEKVMQRFQQVSSELPLIQVRLVSDFQASQYGYYEAATSPIQWQAQPLEHSQPADNLTIESAELQYRGPGRFVFRVGLNGNTQISRSVQIQVTQQELTLAEFSQSGLQKLPVTLDIPIQTLFDRLGAITLRLKADPPDLSEDNLYFYQWNIDENPWVGIVTSVGNEAIFYEGLHQLKAALLANGYHSFVVPSLQMARQHSPDLMIYLGDHPQRWSQWYGQFESNWFIPTLPEQWVTQPQVPDSATSPAFSTYPADQHWVDWPQQPDLQSWNIQRESPELYRAAEPSLFLLGTGLSPAWGGLYQDAASSDHFRGWVRSILRHKRHRHEGTHRTDTGPRLDFLSGQQSVQWLPGHYQIEHAQSGQTFSFAVNLPSRESQLQTLNLEQIEQLEDHFEERFSRLMEQVAGPSVQAARRWLLWLLGGMALLEVALMLGQHQKPH